jgi:Ca2+-binding EF-hand superfamily protein
MNPKDAELLFALFDRDGSGTISFEEFLSTIRGPMKDERKVFIDIAFDILDKDGNGIVEPTDLIG